jgi:predicted alpha/beta hydrolase
MKTVEVISKSGTLSCRVFEGKKAKSILIIASATGVKQSFYQKFAEYTASNGFTVVTFDYYGIGDSLILPIKQLTNNVEGWAVDLEAVIAYCLEMRPNSKVSVMGHSMGGQLIGLCPSASRLQKIVLVAAQSGYWKYWKGFGKSKMWFNWYVLFPVLNNLFGYFPGKRISGMENLPKGVARQWSKWGRRKSYILSEIAAENLYYQKIKSDIVSFSIDDDDYAPKEAVEWMTNQYRNSNIKSTHLKPIDFGVEKIGHFGVFKDKFKTTIWEILLNEIK